MRQTQSSRRGIDGALASMGVGLALVMSLGAGIGCGDGGRDEKIDLTGSSTGTSTGTGGSGGSSDSTTGPEMKLDAAPGIDLGFGDLNCDAIDFLFVIDNSSSMEREQARLIEAVPGFTDTILTALPTVSDIRVGVVDTDTYPGLGSVDPLDGCPDGQDCSGCDYQLGALLTKPASAIDPAVSCNFADGLPYMDVRNDTFADEFACVAEVGIEGNQIEQQAGAMVSALTPEMLGAGGCNEGFLRDDALLIVLVITDEEDNFMDAPAPQGGSMGNPSEWIAAVIEAKGGIETNAVGLGLIGGDPLFDDCDVLTSSGIGAEGSPRLMELLESFDQSFVGSVCQGDYIGFFEDALFKVAQGCQQFQPG